MHIETIKPCPALAEYIDFYYLIREDAADFKSIHYSFPHTVNVVSIYQHADFHSTVDKIEIFHKPENNFLTLIQGKRQLPLKVELTGSTNRISIFFKPFGLNHFITKPLSTVMGNKTISFLEWNNDPAYHLCLENCFATTNMLEKIKLLEIFLLTILQPMESGPIERAVMLLCDVEKEYKIDEICLAVDMPLRTFNRQFKSMMGVSPTEYRSISRFRHSLNNKFFNTQFKRLTDIGYGSSFYDQSYFIKIYKKLTGSNPTAFFNAVEKLGDDKLIFQFVNK